MNVFADTFACCLCRLLSIQEMWGLELNDDFPVRAQRFVRVNRRVSLSPMRRLPAFFTDESSPHNNFSSCETLTTQKPRGDNINNVTFGLTGRRDLMGMAIDGEDNYYVHSMSENGILFTLDPLTGAITEKCETGLVNILDIAYRINRDEIWAINSTGIFIIDHNNGCENIKEFSQDFLERFPEERFASIGFNPVEHVPIVLTAGVYDNGGGVITPPTLYRFIIANGTEVLQGPTNITDGIPQAGKCIQT